ncbi:hypothetical protein C8Q79DRAFT_936129 [Trametes meyenii]|nr:hypothetical protein C8Q79DRAFT_936129 [Trametes meyenii]
MSEQVARAHTSLSNRSRTRKNTESKTVFRGVVDNPFHVQWPMVPLNVQNAILACLVEILSGVAECHLSREQASRRKRKRTYSSRGVNAAAKAPNLVNEDAAHGDRSTAVDGGVSTHRRLLQDRTPASTAAVTSPILQSLTIGINEVTKRLEGLASSHRCTISSDDKKHNSPTAKTDKPSSGARLVVACRADVNPPALIAHIPNLVAAVNSLQARFSDAGRTWLVSLPKGSEHTLAEAVGLRRTSILLIEESATQFALLAPLLQDLPLISAPWLSPAFCDQPVALVPTHIKQLRTTAPKDMKSAKERRIRQRAAAKKERNSRSNAVPKRLTITSTR